MTKSLTEQYKKGYTPPALQRKYGLTYVQGYELAEDFKKLEQQLAEANEILDIVEDMYPNTIKAYFKKWGVK